MQPIHVARCGEGLTYVIAASPASLPPVLLRDLVAAWEGARQAALDGQAAHVRRAFSFARPDGGTTKLALCDRDAQCWAQAVDRRLDLASTYGLSVCLRLLALVDLLAHTPWARARVRLCGSGAELDPALLRLAASAKLTDEAGFDEAALRRSLAGPSVPARAAEPVLKVLQDDGPP